ncbi:hypothetical protein DRQ07_10060, partial [candidate division KSB1 bacterium]
LLMGLVGSLSAQAKWNKESLTRGKVWLTIANSLRLGEVDLPWTYYAMDYPGYSTGSNLSDKSSYIQGGGYMIYGERGGVAEAYTISGCFYASSKYVYPTVNSQLIKNYNLTNPAIEAEEEVTGAHHVIALDVDVAHKSMVWSFPGYSDFVIHEYTITNTGDTPLENVHFGTRLAINNTWKGDFIGPGTDQDDKYGWDEANQCFYVYDDRSFNWADESPIQFNFGPGPVTGDIGDPADITSSNSTVHELYSPGYFSSICLDPAGAPVYQNILEYVGQATSSNGPVEDWMPRLGSDNPADFLAAMTHQQPRMSWDEARAAGGEGGNKYERSVNMLISCGPHNIAAGSSITLVFAEVLGEMDRAKIVQGGVENVNLLATESKAALLENVAACKDFYNSGYKLDDYPPMTPTDGENSLDLVPVGGGIQISWPAVPDSYTDPATGEHDFAGYKVYRSDYFCTGPWNLSATISKDEAVIEDGKVVYTDTGLPLGVGVYYTVTTYDEAGNESGKVNPNRYPVYPLRATNPDFPKKVYVVPNPFRQNSGLLGSGEELRMEFIGLPAKCTIRIYTLTGELVREIEHDDGSGAESWGSMTKLDYQTNKWMMYVAPGVYIYHVKSNVEGHTNEVYIGKFAIIK